MNQKKILVTIVYLILLFLLVPFHIMAQSPSDVDSNLSLSLQEAMEIALEQNFTIEQAEFDVDKIRAQYRQTNALFLPQISFDYSAVSTNDPLNVFGFKLKQEIVTQQDFNPMLLTDPDVTQNYSASFQVQQPLFNPDMMLQRSAIKNQLYSVDEQLTGTRKYVEFQVRNQYYNLILHHRQLDVLETALATAAERMVKSANFSFLPKINFFGSYE